MDVLKFVRMFKNVTHPGTSYVGDCLHHLPVDGVDEPLGRPEWLLPVELQ
jgi:hypothetical protein